MTVEEYEAMKKQRAMLNNKQEAFRLQKLDLLKQAETCDCNRRNVKEQVNDLDKKLQEFERDHATKQRKPHPTKPHTVIEEVVVEVEKEVVVEVVVEKEVEKPLSWGRAAMKVFTGR